MYTCTYSKAKPHIKWDFLALELASAWGIPKCLNLLPQKGPREKFFSLFYTEHM